MLGWCIVTLASARLKAFVWFPPLRGMYQRGSTCKGCDTSTLSRPNGQLPTSILPSTEYWQQEQATWINWTKQDSRLKAQTHQRQTQWNRAQWVQTHGKPHQFRMGDYVLWFPKGTNVHAGKLGNKWFGPYRVQYLLPNNTILLVTVDKFDPDPVIVNIQRRDYRTCPAQTTGQKLS